MSHAARAPIAIFGAVGLGAVLKENETSTLAQVPQRSEVGAFAIEMDRKEALRPRVECRLGAGRVHGQRLWVNVHQHRDGAGLEHGGNGRSAGVTDRDDFVAWAHAQGLEGEPYGIGAARYPHAL